MTNLPSPKPESKAALWMLVKAAFGLQLPWEPITPGHNTPFEFLSDCFFNPGQDAAIWSCRSGIKTLTLSILAALEFMFADNLQARVLSGSEDQARNLYEYWERWCNTILRGRLSGPVNRLLTRVMDGRLEILAASQKRVRGPKIQRLYQDEVDEIAPELTSASAGMLASTDDHPSSTRYASTWHRVNGPMGKLVAGCPGNGVKLYKWNLWEALERCQPERHEFGKGCQQCPLCKPCMDQARAIGIRSPIGVAAKCRGLYRVEDAIKVFRKVGVETWDAEYLCRRPATAGLVYQHFDPALHVIKAAPENLDVYRSIDFGYGCFVCLWIGVDRVSGVIYVLDTYRAESGTVRQHATAINANRLNNARSTYCDPAGRNRNDQTGHSAIDELRASGISCQYQTSDRWREVANGIRLVRDAIKPAEGSPRLYVVESKANAAFVTDFQSYANRRVNNVYIDDPVDPQPAEHTMDALRYFFVNRASPSVISVRIGAA